MIALITLRSGCPLAKCGSSVSTSRAVAQQQNLVPRGVHDARLPPLSALMKRQHATDDQRDDEEGRRSRGFHVKFAHLHFPPSRNSMLFFNHSAAGG